MAERLVWTPADGSPDIDLTDEEAGYSWEAEGTRGLRSVTYAFASQSYAGIDGEDVQAVRAEANRPSVGMLLQASSEAELRTRARRLVHAMRPKAGPGTLTVTTEDGESRRLTCYVEGGLEGDESDTTTMPGRWWKFVLKLYAPKPWWVGDERVVNFGLAAPSVFLSATLPFPRTLSSSTIQGQQTIDLSDADAPSYPVWTITGPGAGLVLSRTTTDPKTRKKTTRVIQVNTTIGDGQTLVIDTRRGHQAVYRGDLPVTDPGWNRMGSVVSDPALWPLIEGVNEVSAVLGAAGAKARISGRFEPMFAGV